MSKRWLTVARAVAIGLAFASCGGAPDDGGPRSTLTADQASAARAACTFSAGTPPGLSLAKDAPLGRQIPIDTIVLVMMENRSFDHLLEDLPAFGQPDADVAPASATNPNSDGTPVPLHHLDTYCIEDPSHGWTDVHTEWDGGKDDGFVIANNQDNGVPADGTRAMGFYTEADLPWLYAAANTFAIGDRNFSSLLAQTYPNRDYFYAATSFGHVDNVLFSDEMPTIMQSFAGAKVDWRIYYSTIPGMGIFIGTLANYFDDVTFPITQFFADAQAGKLGQVNYVDPDLSEAHGALGNDLHPPGDLQVGQKFLHDVVAAAMASPQWPHMALIITFDEHGGLYDHVPPPTACAPDGIAPMVGPGGAPGDFKTLGFRVPLVVISPYAKPHFVSHTVYDHTSILRFVEARFNLPALTARDANADPLFDLFDFSQPRLLTPPSLPDATVDQAKLDECLAQFPADGAAPVTIDLAEPTDGGAGD